MSGGRPRALTDPSISHGAPTTSPHDLGRGRLEAHPPDGRVQKVVRIDATRAPSSLIGRLLVGSYITGQDRVHLTARGGLTPSQRREIHRVVDRLLGMTVVEDSPGGVEIQNFLDPGKYGVPRLLHRVVQLLEAELSACYDALDRGTTVALCQVPELEEEIDQLYLLMARQLLLSLDSPRVARDIDVESHHFQIGYRLVGKVLEVTGDLVHAVSQDLAGDMIRPEDLPRSVARELTTRVRRLEEILARTMDAFATISVTEANATLDLIAADLPKEADLGPLIARNMPDPKTAVVAQRIACNLTVALEMLVIVNEVTINRGIEPEMVALTRERVVMAIKGASRVPHESHLAALLSEAGCERTLSRSTGAAPSGGLREIR